MRYNTKINNVKCLEWGINSNQGALFDLLYEASSWADPVIVDSEAYYHVSRNLVIEELPLFYDKPDTVYRHLKDLSEKGLIEYKKEGKKDIIKLTEKGKDWNSKKLGNESELESEFGNESEKTRNEIRKGSDLNPTYNNNNIHNEINNNIYSQIIDYLNEKTNKNFRSNISKTQKLIQARTSENFTVEDFKKVIDIKTQEWLKDSTMSKYLRPETLFGSKFESYLNESEGKNVRNKETGGNGFEYSGFKV